MTSLSVISHNNPYKDILQEFIELTRPTKAQKPKHSIQHHIITRGPPVAERARRLSSIRTKAARKQIEDLMTQNICEPSSSPWASPLHLVKKKNGEWRPCGDYHRLNKITVPDKYPIPHIHDFAHLLHDCNIFTVLDLTKAFHQISIAPEDQHKTAIITPFDLFQFSRMTFGLCNAAQTFQRLMDTALRGLDFVFCYIDDILIALSTPEQHREHLRQVFKRLCEYGLSINIEKCIFGATEVRYLGHQINKDGITVLQDRVAAIIDYPKPHTIMELRRFLSLINFYRRFIKNAADIQAPLHALTAGAIKRDRRPVAWTPEAEHAFTECKQKLSSASLLAHPYEGAPFTLCTAASSTAIGATLHQQQENKWVPLGFFSKKLSESQKKYSTYDRELLAIYESIKFFRHMIEGRECTLATDHKPLTYAFDQKLDKVSPRQLRHLNYISQFSSNIMYLPGVQNTTADALSRIQAISMPVIVSTNDIAKEQAADQELQSLLQKENTGLKLIFNATHRLSHPGTRATRELIARKFIWPGFNKDVARWVKTCLSCQRSKIKHHNHTTPMHIQVPDARFYQAHLDIIGPLLPSRGYKYCLIAIDRFTRWPEATPIADVSTDTIVTTFYSTWVARFGAPAVITTDRGSQFESQLFQALAKLIGAERTRTTPYHPASNGAIERFHRSLKAAIRCHANNEWVDTLPTVLLGLRTSLKEDIKTSAAELTYGIPIRIPGEFFFHEDPETDPYPFLEKLRQHIRKFRPSPTAHHSKQKPFTLKDMHTCLHVFVRVDATRKPLD